MDIKAFKMDGLGNDFVIIDQRSQNFNLNKDQIIKVCDRNFIGCDQLILINKNKEIDADVEFYNSDGSASGACGNGTRCVADLLSKESGKKEITLLTASGSLKSKILGNNLVETEIGIPKVNWQEIPLNKQLDTQDLKIENHPLFPEKCNVTLAKVMNKNMIKVKVWERGAGLTKACGTAACSTAVAANINNLVEKTTDIAFALGSLTISIDERNSIHMKGPVSDIKNIDIKL